MGNNTSVNQNFAKTNINVYNSFRRDLDSSTIYKGTKKLYRLTFGQHKPLNNKDYEILKKYFSCRGRYLDEEINCDILAFNIQDIYEKYIFKYDKKFDNIILSQQDLILYRDDYLVSLPYKPIKPPLNWGGNKKTWDTYSNYIFETYYVNPECNIIKYTLTDKTITNLCNDKKIVNLL